jgi:hypothetical protein
VDRAPGDRTEFATVSTPDAQFDAIELRFDEFEAHFVDALHRCMRRQFWTFVGALVVSLGIVLGVLAAFGPDAVGLTAPAFALLAASTAFIGRLRSD